MAEANTLVNRLPVSTRGIQRSADPYNADLVGVLAKRFHLHDREAAPKAVTQVKKDHKERYVNCLFAHNIHAHNFPHAATIEYYEVPQEPEFSADIAPETPDEPCQMGIDTAVRDALIAHYFEAAKTSYREACTDPLLSSGWVTSKRSGDGFGRWFAQKTCELSSTVVSLRDLCKKHHRLRRGTPLRAAAELMLRLEEMRALRDNWNSYSAPAPTAAAIENAKLLVAAARTDGTIPERVEPSAMGGVGVTFARGDREAVVEFYNDGTAHALFADNKTEEMDTRPVTPTAAGFTAFLVEVRTYLHAQHPTAPTH